MRNHALNHDTHSYNVKGNVILSRFRSIIIICLVSLVIALGIFVFISEQMQEGQVVRGLMFFLLLIISLVISAIFHHKNQYDNAVNLFLWSIVIGTMYMHWLSGGILKAPIAINYPSILVLAAFTSNPLNFKLIFAFILAGTFGIYLLESLTLNPEPLLEFSSVSIVLICFIMLASSIVALHISQDYRQLLARLKDKNTHYKKSRQAFYYLAHHDSLTQLYNRAGCVAELQILIKNNKPGSKIIFLFLDLDNFKTINDTYDHAAGDQVLITLGKRFNALSEEGDVISRISGDEFIIAAARDQSFPSKLFAEAILQAVIDPIAIHGADLTVTTSVGLVEYPKDADSYESLHQKADLAMYKAKKLGKNNYYQYDEVLGQENIRRDKIIYGLRTALEEGDIELHFQPRVNLQTNKVQAVEALLRWIKNNPEGFQPDEFIPVIDSTDLIVSIGQWVLQEACVSCKKLQQVGHEHMKVSVNVSPIQLARLDFHLMVKAALAEAKLAPSSLEIELREELLTNKSTTILPELQKLKKMGVTVLIDDFGTGHSSLSYLTRFEVDRLKFDKPFIHDLGKRADNKAIVMAMIKMTRILGLGSTAEGIETAEEASILKHLGCEEGQGYFWGRPVRIEALLEQLDKRQMLQNNTNKRETCVDSVVPVNTPLLTKKLEVFSL